MKWQVQPTTNPDVCLIVDEHLAVVAKVPSKHANLFAAAPELLHALRAAKEIVCVDFDGVLHHGKKPWTNAHEVNDDPVPGAIDFIRHVMDAGYQLVIHTSRALTATTVPHIFAWLEKHGLEEKYRWHIQITALKVAAALYLDDKAMRFTGIFPTVEEIKSLKHWTADEPPVVFVSDEFERGMDLAFETAIGLAENHELLKGTNLTSLKLALAAGMSDKARAKLKDPGLRGR